VPQQYNNNIKLKMTTPPLFVLSTLCKQNITERSKSLIIIILMIFYASAHVFAGRFYGKTEKDLALPRPIAPTHP